MKNFDEIQHLYPEMRFLPIRLGSKAPIGKNWGDKLYTFDDVPKPGDTYQKQTVGAVGLVLGHGGYLGVDQDGESSEAWLLAQGVGLISTLTISSGRDGHCLRIYHVPESSRDLIKTRQYKTGVQGPDGKDEQVELRWLGAQSLVFGQHPSSNLYQITDDAPIAEAPPGLIRLMLKDQTPTDRKQHQQNVTQARHSGNSWTVKEWANEYLSAINLEALGWEGWRNLLFAIHACGFTEQEARTISSRSAKHTDPGFDQVWPHIKGNPGPDVSYLGKLAKQHGWVSPFKKKQAQLQSPEEKQENEESHAWSQSGLANYFVQQFKDNYRFCLETQQWYVYHKGQWRPCNARVIERALIRLVQNTTNQTFKTDLIRGAAYLAQVQLSERDWQTDRKYLPLLNGVLNLATMELLIHSPEFDFRWQLPYEYDPDAKCPQIIAWLTETVGNDLKLVQILRAYLNAVLLGRTDLQKYLEVIGPGGTGKSTYIRLAQALIGLVNSFTTELRRLETNRFETAGLVDKRLCVITDSEHYGGEVAKLKAITGQDSVPIERKYQNVGSSNTPECMVIVASNETIQSGEYTSGLARRRLTIPFLNRVPSEKQITLINFVNGQVVGAFAPELPGLLNWVLELSNAEVSTLIRTADTDSEVLRQYKADTLINSNPIAAWADECLLYDPTAKTYVGLGKKVRNSVGTPSGLTYLDTFEFADSKLYPNYCDHCQDAGVKTLSCKRFVPLLKDLLTHQLGWQVEYDRDKFGWHFTGVRLRHPSDAIPRPISEVLVCANF